MFGRGHEREVFTDSLNNSKMKSSSSTSAADENLYPPVARKECAYLYLAAMLMIETFLWGYAGAFGVLLNFYEEDSSNPSYCSSSAKVALSVVGTINSGIIAVAAPFVSCWIVKAPGIRRMLMFTGAATCGLSLFLSSFSTSALHVLLTQGIGYAVGGSVLYFSAISYLPEWFEEKQGCANGIIFSGTGLGGAIFPLILNGLLTKFGAKWTLRIIAALFTFITLTAVLLIRPRRSTKKICHEGTQETALTCDKDPPLKKSPFSFRTFCLGLPATFWIFVFTNFLQATAFYLPGLYLPSYMSSLGRSPVLGSALVSLLYGASMFAQLAGGALSDHFPPHLLGTISSTLGGVSVLVFWGTLGHHGNACLFIFSVAYGFTAGMWTSLYFSALNEFAVYHELVLPAYGILSLTRGLGSIVAGPVSSALIPSNTTHQAQSGVSPGGSFSKLIWFTGVALLINGLIESFLWLYLRSTNCIKTLETSTITEKIEGVDKKESKLNSQKGFILPRITIYLSFWLPSFMSQRHKPKIST